MNNLANDWKYSKKQRSPSMTVTIGLKSSVLWNREVRRVVLAADSATTYQSGQKDLDAQKLHIIEFSNGSVLTGQSGFEDPASCVIQALRTKAKNVQIKDFESVKNCFEEILREVRKSLAEGHNFDDERRRQYLQCDVRCEFLVAFHCEGQAHLCHIDNYVCAFSPIEKNYRAIGIGSDLAAYLLKEFSEAAPNFEYADFIAPAIIEKVKKHIKDCEGPTRMGASEASRAPNRVCDSYIYRMDTVNSLCKEIAEQELQLLPSKRDQMRETLQSLCSKVGMIRYTDSRDGDRGTRLSGYFKNDEDAQAAYQKLIDQGLAFPTDRKLI